MVNCSWTLCRYCGSVQETHGICHHPNDPDKMVLEGKIKITAVGESMTHCKLYSGKPIGVPVRLKSVQGLEDTSLVVGEKGQAICNVSGNGMKNGMLVFWDREIRKGSFMTRDNCPVEAEQLEFI